MHSEHIIDKWRISIHNIAQTQKGKPTLSIPQQGASFMNQAVEEYHRKRRAFIILPQVGIIIGEQGQPYSHREILKHIGCSDKQISHILENYRAAIF